MHEPHSFVAYIDESGDEGFKFDPNPGKGSSDWFVLAAAISRVECDLQTVAVARRARAALHLPANHTLHFTKLNHSRRLTWSRIIGGSHLTTIVIAIDKQALASPDRFRDGNRLYHYATRLLLERISWFCRDSVAGTGDGTVRVIFSNRSSLSYEDIRHYANHLKRISFDQDVRVYWPVIAIDAMCARTHHQLAGLQTVDAVASGYWHALNLDRYGNREDRYAHELWRRAYRNGARAIGNGLKVFPNPKAISTLVPWAK